MQNTQSFYLAPGNLDLVVVAGPDAVKLLQGQLTCDVQALSDNSFTRGAACNNKGRIYATFVLVRHADTFFLVFNHGVGSGFAAALKKFLPFYKCSLQLAPSEWRGFAGAGPAAVTAFMNAAGDLPATNGCKAVPGGWLCRLSDDHLIQCTSISENVEPMQVMPELPPGEEKDWLLHEMLAGYFPFTPEDSEKYTPQELQLDAHGYVSFNKGCYTGQEIVARMHYRGKVKKQLYLLSTDAAGGGPPGADFGIHDAEGALLGHPLKQYRSDSGTLYLLAQLPIGLAEQSSGVCDSNGHPLSVRAF